MSESAIVQDLHWRIEALIEERDAARKIAQELAAALEPFADTYVDGRGLRQIGDSTDLHVLIARKAIARYAADAAAQEGRDG